MVPYLSAATVNGKKITDLVDHEWIDKTFNPTV